MPGMRICCFTIATARRGARSARWPIWSSCCVRGTRSSIAGSIQRGPGSGSCRPIARPRWRVATTGGRRRAPRSGRRRPCAQPSPAVRLACAGRGVDTGQLVPLDEQGWSAWDRTLIAEGNALIRERIATVAAGGGPPGRTKLLAAINAVHTRALSARDTNWLSIVALYDRLVLIDPSPIVRLNRAVAVAEVDSCGAWTRRNRPARRDPQRLPRLPRGARRPAAATRGAAPNRGRRTTGPSVSPATLRSGPTCASAAAITSRLTAITGQLAEPNSADQALRAGQRSGTATVHRSPRVPVARPLAATSPATAWGRRASTRSRRGRAALNTAQRQRLIGHNPAADLELPPPSSCAQPTPR